MAQPRQSGVIRPDSKLTSKKLLLEVLQKMYDSKKLFAGYAITSFSLTQRFIAVGYHAFDSSLTLRQDSSHGCIGRVCIQELFVVIRWHCKDQRGRE